MERTNRRQLAVLGLVASSALWSTLIASVTNETLIADSEHSDGSRGLFTLEVRGDASENGRFVVPINAEDELPKSKDEIVFDFLERQNQEESSPNPNNLIQPNFGDKDNDPFATIEYNTLYRGHGGITRRGHGGIVKFGRGEHFEAPVDEVHAVKCCASQAAVSPGPSWSKKSSQKTKEWCPHSYNMGEGECVLMSYHGANEFCASKGGRLCTPDELFHRCAISTGCDDNAFAWTHDERIGDGAANDAVAPVQDNSTTLIIGRPLIHVFSPFVDRSTNAFAPLNMDQWTMLVSAKASRDAFNRVHQNITSTTTSYAFDSVILVCAILKIDEHDLRRVLMNFCDHVVVLPRSTVDVYPNLNPLPFVQDIVDAGKSVMTTEGDFHLLLTNADISPTEKFYQFAETLLRLRKSKAIGINPMIVDKKNLVSRTNNDQMSMELKHKIAMELSHQAQVTIEKGKARFQSDTNPGHDCFVFQSSILDMINFGDMFLGYPQWGGSVHFMLDLIVDKYEDTSPKRYGTFHIGEQRTWRTKYNSNDISSWKELGNDELQHLYSCPLILEKSPPSDVHTLQNLMNCGKLFKSRPYRDTQVPGFVQPGYEDVYLSKDTDHLTGDYLKQVFLRTRSVFLSWLLTPV